MPSSLASPSAGFNDAAILLNSIVSQATGRQGLVPTTLAEFVSTGTTALSMGFDPLLNAISQVIGNTIFSIRPYSEKFGGLRADRQRWGNHVRKLKIADSDWETDQRYYEAASDFLDSGDSVDMYRINKPNVLQLNFYGQNVFQRHITMFRDQLDVAFRNPDELLRFNAMITQNISDQLAQAREETARAALANMIAGKNIIGGANVIHLITEYNNATGQTLTAATVNNPANYATFIRWVYGFIKTLSNRFEERSVMYQQNVTGKEISQHTPKARQKFYVSDAYINRMDAEVRSITFNKDLLGLGEVEQVGYWQSIQNPFSVSVTPSYMDTTGAIVTGAAQEVNNIFGVLFDEEAIMIQQVKEWSAPTPFNAAGGYTNMYWHASHRYLNDFTEKCVVLLMDEAS